MLLYHHFPMARFHLVQGRMRGFTLIEMAFVIVIAGILLAMVIGATASVVENSRLRVTRSNMDSVKTALQGFIARNGGLPCPAIEGRAPAANDYGIEAATPGTCTGTVDLPGQVGPPFVDAAKRGVVPWKTLGMTLESATDGWGNQFTYMVSQKATLKNFDNAAGMRGSLYVHGATPVAAGLPPTGNQINACSTTANDNACNRAAVVVLISHGRNVLGAYPASGVRAPLPTDAAEVENTDANRFVVSADMGPTFDDLVLPLAPDILLGPLAAQGAIKGDRALLVERARQVVLLVASDAVSTRTGTAGDYTYTIPDAITTSAYGFDATKFNVNCSDRNPPTTVGLLPAGHDGKLVLDPWGQEFRYQATNFAIKSGESCPNPAVLVSVGPDSILGTSDDWVYYASLAEWKDVFSRAGW